MCLFPQKPVGKKSKYDITYECGGCPECLAKRSRRWALRAGMEAKYSSAMMVTLTYDEYIYNDRHEVIGEKLNADFKLEKKDIQDFMKRVRRYAYYKYEKEARKIITEGLSNYIDIRREGTIMKRERRHQISILRVQYSEHIKKFISEYVSSRQPKIKMICGAERGKRTNRPHYHLVLFNVPFTDCILYKKSKRGNQLYKSATLTRLWSHGICTIDSMDAGVEAARYCTKYCAKDTRGSDDTFMLFSRRIGYKGLKEEFNGRSYIFAGREYPIPKQIWNEYILEKYGKRYSAILQFLVTKYVPRVKRKIKEIYGKKVILSEIDNSDEYDLFQKGRKRFEKCRNNDPLYKQYLCYWKKKFEKEDLYASKNIIKRILALPNNQYFKYKQAALKCFCSNQANPGIWNLPPRSNCIKRYNKSMQKFALAHVNEEWLKSFVANPPRHNTTNDTKIAKHFGKIMTLRPGLEKMYPIFEKSPF